MGRQAVIFAAGDGEAAAAAAVDAAAVDVALQRVVAIQLDIGVALAGHAYGGFVPAAGVDVHILECDLDLIVPGVDGHGVGRSGVRFLICDDGVLVVLAFERAALLHLVGAGHGTRRNRNVTLLNIIGACKGGEGRPGQQSGGQDKRRCPLRGRTGRIDTPPRMEGGDPEHASQAYDKTTYKNLL